MAGQTIVTHPGITFPSSRKSRTSIVLPRLRYLLATTIVAGLPFSMATGAMSQDISRTARVENETASGASGATVLQTIVVSGSDSRPRGPDGGIVAKVSRSASKTDTTLLETPQAVSIVTRQQMDLQSANTVPEGLRYTPGVLSDPNGYDIRYDWLSVRGFDTYGTIWLDGLVLPGDATNYATPSVNPFALERVEVLKGPASVLYGRAIPGGLVNEVSKRPQTTPRSEISIGTSSFGGVQTSFDFTGPLGEGSDWSYRLLGQARNLHTQIDHERDRQGMLAPSLTWSPSDATSLTLYGYYQKDKPIFSPRFYPAVGTLLPNPLGQIPRDIFLGDPDTGSFERDFFALGYEFSQEINETFTVRQNLRYGKSDQDMFLVLVNPAFAYQPDGHTLNRATAISDDWVSSFNVDTQLEAKFETGVLDHTTLFGVDYLKAKSSTNFGNTGPGAVVPPLDYLNPVYGGGGFPVPSFQRSGLQSQEQTGFYVQDQIKYDRWVGTFGLRYDLSDVESRNRMTANPSVSTRDRELTGRAGLTYLFDNGLAPYVSYSTSFLPTLGTDAAGKPFDAQTADQFEVGVKYEPPGGSGLVTVSLFNLTLDNALTPDPNDVFLSVQGGKQRVRGMEIEGKYELTPEFDLLASYAYSDSEVVRSNNAVELGREVLNLPEHQGSLWLNYHPSTIEGLSLTAGVRALSSYQTDTTYLADLRIPGRALVDVGAQFDFGAVKPEFRGTTLRLNVTNLFDETYVSHCRNITGGSCNYGAGRAVTATLKYTW